MGDEEQKQEKRKRYKSFLDANYKPKDVHASTEQKWRRRAETFEIGGEKTPAFISGKNEFNI